MKSFLPRRPEINLYNAERETQTSIPIPDMDETIP